MLMVRCVLLLVCSTMVLSASIISAGASGETIMDLKMKGAKPEEPDGYICTGYEVPYDEAYIIKYEAMADADTAHHILIYGCDGAAYSEADTWNCPPMCKDSGSQKIIFAWAKNAPPAVLPQGVGFKVGRKSTIKTIVLQIHYAKSFSKDEQPDQSGIRVHLTEDRQPYMAGIFLLMASFFSVPPETPKFHVDASCMYNDETSMFPFAYRTHSHTLGTVITGYQYNGTFHLIGKGNPQWPQAFYPANPSIEVKPGEELIARCTYNSTGRNRVTYVGATGNDEMCNFYIMYYTNSSLKEPGGECYTNQLPLLASMLPADSDVTLPPNPLLDEEAHGHHHHAGMTMTASAGSPTLSAASTGTSGKMIIDVKMKGAKPSEPDGYICTSYEVPYDEAYIVKYEAQADAETAHHILMYGCDGAAYSEADTWNCPAMCKDAESQKIIFAWAKNAPPAVLPEGVGFKVGRKSTIKTIVLQIHYAKSFRADEQADYSGIRVHLTAQRQPYMAGIFLLLASFFQVPGQTPKFHVDASCVYNDETSMFPFAYRTHAHALGTVITGYQYNGTFQLIGKGNPQWPQAFYPANPSIEVKPGEKLIARCTYNSTGRDRVTYVGATGNDEMCNFYIMYYTNSSLKEPGGECYTNQLPSLASMLPADSDVPLPPNPFLDEEAHGHHHHAGMTMTASAEGDAIPSLSTASTVEPLSGALQFQSNWPAESVRVGQVAGLATDKQGNIYVFHRGTRIWTAQSFDYKHQFQFQNQPIKEDTVLIFSKDGKLLRTFGAGLFYMPHGMTVDHNGNMWLTDVALHQVFRIPAGGTKPDLELGERFIHGDDSFHFCKPADVAVLTSGEFFVSDGYCNSRIVKFSKDGSFIKQWGSQSLFEAQGPPPGTFDIPHSITVAEDLGLVCVADRENSRIQCFDLQGAFVRQIKHKDLGSRLFAIEYCPHHGGLLFAVNGHSFEDDNNKAQGFTIDARSGSILEHWNLPQGLHTPHDVAVDDDGHNVYVGELTPSAVWKFSRQLNITTQHSAGTQPLPQATINKESITQIADKKNNIEAEPANPEDGTTMEPARKELLKTLTDQTEAEKSEEEDLSDFTPSIIIGVLLVIPVILLLVITLILRMHSRGRTACFSGLRSPKVFSLQGFLGSSHKGFDKLSQDDSDHEGDAHSDSDHEEFRQPQKGKNKA